MNDFPLLASGGLDACSLLCNHKKTALFGATSEFSFSSQFGNPFTVVMEEITEEIWIPTAKLTHNGRLLDILLPLLGKCLV